MLFTPLGDIDIRVDGKPIAYELQKVEYDPRCKDLSGRFFALIAFVPDGKRHLISCALKDYAPSIKDGIESGENLMLKSFYRGKVKLSIGMEGDVARCSDGTRISRYDFDSAYLEHGVQYEIRPETKTSQYVFGIAWIENYDDDNEVQTWLGADPTSA